MAKRAASASLVTARSVTTACLADLQDGDLVVVACSGGPDSLALAGVTAWVGARRGLRTHAVVVDHGLQQGSGDVAQWAAAVCVRLGVQDASVITASVGDEGGPEAAARAARYAALDAAAVELGASTVLLGHTLDDQAETVLLRLARGSGARSLAAMRARSGPYRRPFLDLPRREVHAVASELLEPLGERPWLDPHNDDPAYLRVRVRRLMTDLVDALGPGASLSLARSAALLRDDADALDLWTDQVADELLTPDADEVEVEALTALPRAVRTRVIRRMCLAAGCLGEELTAEHVLRVEALVSDWHGQGEVSLPSGVHASRAYGRLCVRSARTETE